MELVKQSNAFAYIGLGSNMGDREGLLHQAVHLLHEHSQIKVTRSSGLYETDPVGYVDQNSFLNMVIEVETVLPVETLFQYMLDIEQRLGRIRHIRWGPRTIDLDLLFFENQDIQTDSLIVPHPRMRERAFVLIPLYEIIQNDRNKLRDSVGAQLQNLDGREGVKEWKKTSWPNALEPFVN